MCAKNNADPWPAPVAEGPLDATVEIPGSKSLSNRYLILAALGSNPVRIEGLLQSRDTELMMQALRELGVGIKPDENDRTCIHVVPPASGVFHGGVAINCGLAGTVMRFVPSLALFADGPVRFDGDEQAYRRPMKPVLDGLEQLGARIDYEEEPGFLPFTLTPPSGLKHGILASDSDANERAQQISIDSSSSSQFISSLLLIGSRLPYGLHLRHTGAGLPSMPHINMTVADVRMAGGEVLAPSSGEWIVKQHDLQLPDGIVVEPDLSNAAPFLGAALIAGGAVRVPRWPRSTTQPGGLLPDILSHLGATVTWDDGAYDSRSGSAHTNGVLEVHGDGHIHGLGRFDMSAAGEIAPSIAALAVFADSPTTLVGIGHLRGHETNRLAALVNEIRRIGAGANELDDGIEITPVPRGSLHGCVMETYADHRMATFAAMIGLAVPGTSVIDIATTRKTIPDFPAMWNILLGV